MIVYAVDRALSTDTNNFLKIRRMGRLGEFPPFGTTKPGVHRAPGFFYAIPAYSYDRQRNAKAAIRRHSLRGENRGCSHTATGRRSCGRYNGRW